MRQAPRKTRYRHGKAIRLLIALAWVFAGLHAGQHHFGKTDGLGQQDQCQICRVNHLPPAPVGVAAVLTPATVWFATLRPATSHLPQGRDFTPRHSRDPPRIQL